MTRRVPNGYVTVVDGREVLIERLTPSKRERREWGLPRVLFVVEDADLHTWLKDAVKQAQELVRREPYTLIVRTRTRPDLPGLRVDIPFEEGVRLIESLETIDDSLTFELKARVDVPAAA